jgi:two-component system, NarL family, invasion response regulator UvrY
MSPGTNEADNQAMVGQSDRQPEPGLSASNAPPVRILLVDDHGLVRQALKQVITHKRPHVIFGEAQNAHEALQQVHSHSWDVVLLDITMPGRSGLDVLREIKTLQPESKVLVLTMHPEDQYAMRALKAGASGYLTKETASEEVANAVAKVLRGGKYVSATLAERLAGNLSLPTQKAPHETLSDREYQVMRLIALGKSVKEISFELSLSVKTVSTHRTRLLKKLKFETNADVIRYAMRERLVD